MECPKHPGAGHAGREAHDVGSDALYLQSHQEEDPTDSDQDEDSAEEMYQQARQNNMHPQLDVNPILHPSNLPSHTSTFAQFQNLLAQPHFLHKIKLENETNLLEGRSADSIDALHRAINDTAAVLNNGSIHNFSAIPNLSSFNLGNAHAFLAQTQNSHTQLGNFGNVSGSRIVSPVNTRRSESPMESSPGSSEVRETNNNNSSSSNSNNNRELQNTRAECSNTVQGSVTGASNQPGTSQQSGSSHRPAPSPLPSNSQQTSWSFEDQFKQLYELSDDPLRKEFLDDLFSFMQTRGQPINRLPIMAKSVLDLFELYNLVIQRGGLVEVINKKLWQEIIKGLRLPSSITSAAFTLRTQYRKYLYDYECSKEQLSTPEELQVAIDGNRREGRRSSYSTYSSNGANVENSVVPRAQHLTTQMGLTAQPISLPIMNTTGHHNVQLNGNGHNTLPHHLHLPQGNPLNQGNTQGPVPGQAPTTDVVLEYIKLFNLSTKEDAGIPSSLMYRNVCIGNGSPGASSPPRDNAATNAIDVLKSSWSTLYNSVYAGRSRQLTSPPRNQPRSPGQGRARSPMLRARSPLRRRSPLQRSGSPEPQALDLVRSPGRSPAVRSPPSLPGGSSQMGGRNQHLPGMPSYSVMRAQEEENTSNNFITINCQTTRRNSVGSLSICANFGGIVYEGVLLPREDNEALSHRATPENTP